MEYHNRLDEFFRLKERGVAPEVLRDHATGVREARGVYLKKGTNSGKSVSMVKWADQNLPDLHELTSRFATEEGAQ